MKYNYQIMQGCFNKFEKDSLDVNESCIAEANTKAEAKKLFNKFKHNTAGYPKNRGYKVATTLLKNDEYEYSEVIDYYEAEV